MLLVLISVTGGRFPRALPQPPRRASSPPGSSAHAIPAGKILDELSFVQYLCDE